MPIPDSVALTRLVQALQQGSPKPWDQPMSPSDPSMSPQPPSALTPPPSDAGPGGVDQLTPPPTFDEIANPDPNEELIKALMKSRETWAEHPWVQKLKGVFGGPGQAVE